MGADQCSNTTVAGPAGSGSYPLGTTTLTFSDHDACGNSNSCNSSVTVYDTTAPTISCPAGQTVECTGNASAQINVPSPTSSDICTPTTVQGPAGTNTYPLGTTTISF